MNELTNKQAQIRSPGLPKTLSTIPICPLKKKKQFLYAVIWSLYWTATLHVAASGVAHLAQHRHQLSTETHHPSWSPSGEAPGQPETPRSLHLATDHTLVTPPLRRIFVAAKHEPISREEQQQEHSVFKGTFAFWTISLAWVAQLHLRKFFFFWVWFRYCSCLHAQPVASTGSRSK